MFHTQNLSFTEFYFFPQITLVIILNNNWYMNFHTYRNNCEEISPVIQCFYRHIVECFLQQGCCPLPEWLHLTKIIQKSKLYVSPTIELFIILSKCLGRVYLAIFIIWLKGKIQDGAKTSNIDGVHLSNQGRTILYGVNLFKWP